MLFIHAADQGVERLFDHQTGSSHRAQILNQAQAHKIAGMMARKILVGVTGNATDADDDSTMLYCVILVIQFSAHRSDFWPLGVFKQAFQPIRGDDRHIVIKQQ